MWGRVKKREKEKKREEVEVEVEFFFFFGSAFFLDSSFFFFLSLSPWSVLDCEQATASRELSSFVANWCFQPFSFVLCKD